MLATFERRFPALAGADLLDGVDLSGFQAPSIWNFLDWARWSCSKVTEGANFTERLAIDHSMAALARGIPFGLYHFARFGNVDAEAAHYLAGVRMVEANIGRLPAFHMLDAEADVAGDVTAWCERWCQIVEAAVALPVIVYTGPGWANSHLTRRGTGLEARPLWNAHYANAGTTEPWLPTIWADWLIWQWTSTLSGFGNLDVNVAKPTLLTLLHAPPHRKEDLEMTKDELVAIMGGGYTVDIYEETDRVWRGYGAGQTPPPGAVLARQGVPVLVAWVVEAATEARVQRGRLDRLETTLGRIEAILANLTAGGKPGVPQGTAAVTGTLELRPAP